MFSYISGNETLQVSLQAQKAKKSTPRKFLTLQETEAPKTFLTFSQKKAFLIFQETETLKISLYFRELFIFQKVTFQDQKVKKLYIFQEVT